MVPILPTSDAAVSIAWFEQYGFITTFEHRFEPHMPAYVGMEREGAEVADQNGNRIRFAQREDELLRDATLRRARSVVSIR